MTRYTIWILIILLIIGSLWYFFFRADELGEFLATATYSCSGQKSLTASFYESETTVSIPPVPSGTVMLVLSDGRSLTLPQTLSASGIRYANEDESIIFWNVGNTATLTESDTKTYNNCVSVREDSGGLPNIYSSDDGTFAVRYPEDYTLDTKHVYDLDDMNLSGVAFIIPEEMAKTSNLSSGTYVSVEVLPKENGVCSAAAFFPSRYAQISEVTEGGVVYSEGKFAYAGAGNSFDEIVYVREATNVCVGIRYYIHTSVFENYPMGSIERFDKDILLAQFDKIRDSLTAR
jgi:membrane-bound inhibitor of C-type lysozyme